jgi:hypothetical protein
MLTREPSEIPRADELILVEFKLFFLLALSCGLEVVVPWRLSAFIVFTTCTV